MAANKRSIPLIQARLRELSDKLSEPELYDLADELGRKPAVTRAKPKSAICTPEMAEDIRQLAAKNPNLHQRHIAQQFNVNPGRVSEALNGLR